MKAPVSAGKSAHINQKYLGTALPVHDGILVNANYEEAAKEVMVGEFRKATGLVPEISTEHP